MYIFHQCASVFLYFTSASVISDHKAAVFALLRKLWFFNVWRSFWL